MAGKPEKRSIDIQITNCSHTYTYPDGKSRRALSRVTFDARQGEYIAVIGANGAGKSTFVRHINGLLLPSAGSVTVGGEDTRKRDTLPGIRRKVAMIFQDPVDQIVGTTVWDDAAFGPENLGWDVSLIKRRVREALTELDLWELREREPHTLSQGQQQRLAIAGALVIGPRWLILDEAGAMLDPDGKRHLREIARDLHNRGMGIIAVTHDMNEAREAERLVVFHRGEIEADGRPEQVFSSPRLSAWGLEKPDVWSLAEEYGDLFPTLTQSSWSLQTVPELANLIAEELE